MALLNSGDRVTGTLVIDRLLGEGSFAEVHRVRHEHLGLQAMKLFKRIASLEETHRMLDEARLLSTLGHANIVRLFDAGTVRTPEGLRGFFTMEYVPGGSLETLTAAYPRGIPTDLVVRVTEQMAGGLALAHEQDPPVVHRDLTPANVLIGYEGGDVRVRVSDFGLARRADPVTRMASGRGTIVFMAPEVLGYLGHSCASDVWSVGTIAYLLLTGYLPYGEGLGLARFDRPLLPPSRYNDEVDRGLDEIVMATLALDPRDRPATAGELAAALRERRASVAGPPDERARRIAAEALRLHRVPGQLAHATALMEEAVELWPPLRELHRSRLALWRRGVVL
ncbi:serine/threonine-protein kinase [Nonomuraea fuscirosea]|uniref:serine/threonine-protein kinase n=1 Tax=Nonomuraea fuscirosea TaxID=1291556 RepID=UPI003796D0E2